MELSISLHQKFWLERLTAKNVIFGLLELLLISFLQALHHSLLKMKKLSQEGLWETITISLNLVGTNMTVMFHKPPKSGFVLCSSLNLKTDHLLIMHWCTHGYQEIKVQNSNTNYTPALWWTCTLVTDLTNFILSSWPFLSSSWTELKSSRFKNPSCKWTKTTAAQLK